jgi:hypothetical protein
MDFSKASFNPATGNVTFEATDKKSSKHYKVEGELKGNRTDRYPRSE